MSIRITRNTKGNCITFIGSSQPAYWNACLSGRVNPDDSARVDVINDVRTVDNNDPVFEFYAVDYTVFQDAEGNTFDSAGEAAKYITEKANVLTDAVELTANDKVNFSRDPTNTSILTSLGDNYGVNSIKAIAADDGTITIREFQDDSGQDLYLGLRSNKTRIGGQSQSLSINAVVNSLNALFSVNPVGLGVEDAVISFLYTQETPSITSFGDCTDSAGVVTKGSNTGSQRNDGFHTDSADNLIINAGDYYQINTTGYDFGRNFLFGLFNKNGIGVDAAFDSNRGRGGKLDLGLRLASNAAYEDGPHGVVIEEGFFKDPQNSTQFRVGMNADRRLFVSHFSTETNEYQDVVRSAFPVDSGNEFMLVGYIRSENGQFNANVLRNKLADSVSVAYRYIESPDNVWRYPLFATPVEAGAVSLANGGNDSSEARLFTDDPSGSTWYSPATGYVEDGTFEPQDSGDVTWTEIPSATDAEASPPAFSIADQTFTENAAANISLGTGTYTQSLAGDLPAGLTYNSSTGYITGTTPYVSKDKSWSVTLTRSNAFGSTSDTFAIAITNNASLDNITGLTTYLGNTIQPDLLEDVSVMDSDYGFFADINQKLERGQQVDWIGAPGDANSPNAPTYPYWATPFVGIVDSTMDSADKAANTDSATWLVGSSWDVRTVIFGDWVGGNGVSALVGWDDNGKVVGSGFVNVDKTFRMALSDSDGLIRLYRSNGSGFDLLKTSTTTFDSEQRLSMWWPSTYNPQRAKIPSFTFSNIGANDSTPPAGFASPLTHGLMGGELIMGDGDSAGITTTSAATFLDTLEPGKRFIIPKEWINTNVLTLMRDSGMGFNTTQNEGGKVFIGVPKRTADLQSNLFSDFTAHHRWEYISPNGSFKLQKQAVHNTGGSGGNAHVQIGSDIITISTTNFDDAYYDCALEWDGEQFYAIQCNVGDLNQQPGIENGGSFSRVISTDDSARAFTNNDYASDSAVNLAVAVNNNGRVRLQRSGLQFIDIPLTSKDFVAHRDSAGAELTFNDSALPRSSLTLTAGHTYRFYENQLPDSARISFVTQAGDTPYTTGVTRKGSYPDYLNYTQIAVDSAVPPLKMRIDSDAGIGINISGSSYTAPITGVTLLGPQNNIDSAAGTLDSDSYFRLNETLSAGERLVLNGQFFADLMSKWGTATGNMYIGLGPDSDHGVGYQLDLHEDFNLMGPYLRFRPNRVYLYNANTSQGGGFSNQGSYANLGDSDDRAASSAFIEISADGTTISAGLTNGTDGGDATSTPQVVWPAKKSSTSGFTITTGVNVIGNWYSGGSSDPFVMDSVDWTRLYEVTTPSLNTEITTAWNKAVDFSGSSEHMVKVSNTNANSPLRMGGIGGAHGIDSDGVPVNSVEGESYTSDANFARPWATACVFQTEGHSSTQYIWSNSEGTGSTNDAIYLRTDANKHLYFGWGRTGAYNECRLAPKNEDVDTWTLDTNEWYGVYIGSTGQRHSVDSAGDDRLSEAFEIRLMSSDEDGGGAWNNDGYDVCRPAGWQAGANGFTTGNSVEGTFQIGARNGTAPFHGKVASCVVTTLRRNVAMPSDNEITQMVIDPTNWLQNYRVNVGGFGATYRAPDSKNDATAVWQTNNTASAEATQVYVMGEGTGDAYPSIRNQGYTGDTSVSSMTMTNMVSNDIETVTVDGLT
jgi:hypothetical protein